MDLRELVGCRCRRKSGSRLSRRVIVAVGSVGPEIDLATSLVEVGSAGDPRWK